MNNVLIENIKLWATERNLHNADPKAQMLKVTEEVGEVAGALAKGDVDSLPVEIGDVVVTLVILAMQHGLDLNECTNAAYQKILNRKGKMLNGVYVKESDLND